MSPDQICTDTNCGRPPCYPPIRHCHPLWIGAAKRKMPSRIQRKRPRGNYALRNVAFRIFSSGIRMWTDRQNDRLPSVFGKITCELESAMYAASPTVWRVVISDHQDLLQWVLTCPPRHYWPAKRREQSRRGRGLL